MNDLYETMFTCLKSWAQNFAGEDLHVFWTPGVFSKQRSACCQPRVYKECRTPYYHFLAFFDPPWATSSPSWKAKQTWQRSSENMVVVQGLESSSILLTKMNVVPLNNSWNEVSTENSSRLSYRVLPILKLKSDTLPTQFRKRLTS